MAVHKPYFACLCRLADLSPGSLIFALHSSVVIACLNIMTFLLLLSCCISEAMYVPKVTASLRFAGAFIAAKTCSRAISVLLDQAGRLFFELSELKLLLVVRGLYLLSLGLSFCLVSSSYSQFKVYKLLLIKFPMYTRVCV